MQSRSRRAERPSGGARWLSVRRSGILCGMQTLLRFSACLLALALVAPASAQDGVANSGMGQGEARITSRSDVRLSMESMPGTGGAAVTALGQRVGARMAQIRGCYEQRVEEDPTITGTLRLRFLLEGRGRPRVEVDRDGVDDAALVTCITRELQRLDIAQLTRPTRAIVALQLANTAARGAEQSAARAQEARQVTMTADGDGNPTATGGTPDGRVRFTVTGRGRESGPTVAAAHRALMSALPGLMDCRRRSGRQGRAPGGDLSATLQIRTGQAPTARVTRSRVEGERRAGFTQTCVGRALDGIEQRPTEGRGAVRVEIHFEPATDVEAD